MTPAEHMARAEADSVTRRRREVEALTATARQAIARNSILIEQLTRRREALQEGRRPC
ncbi:hypothetical protein [Xanthobacter flavus]|uniref:hypothetical protein n=1 Tax=Xanthobacter flavus TaxID=281 RepID=UPI00372726BD